MCHSEGAPPGGQCPGSIQSVALVLPAVPEQRPLGDTHTPSLGFLAEC